MLKLEDARLDVAQLPGGAVGSAAIYTDVARPTHVIRKVILRQEGWLNYVF